MSARTSMQFSVVRRVESARPVLRIVEAPTRESGVGHRPSRTSYASRPSFGLFALRTPPELGLLPALVLAAGASAALGFLAHAGLERWVLLLSM